MTQSYLKPKPKSKDKAADALVKRAVIYLRVSSDVEVERGFGEEGYSIPAQREACERKAADLGAIVVRTYVDLAKTAKTKARPQFQEMVADIERDRDIDFAIVHKLNRFARNAMDDSVIAWRLQQAGAQLVSVLEPIDRTPAGKLTHRMFAALAEYENENLAAEIRKGQVEKTQGWRHAVYGTGRLQARPDRVPRAADQRDRRRRGARAAGATRLRSLRHRRVQHRPVARHPRAHGLTSRPTRKRTSRPLSRNGVHTMLRNPYYIGTVVYMGNRVEGRHPKLIDPETFHRVQTRLDSQRTAEERLRIHQHYLKGTLTCDLCDGRLIFGKHRGKGGVYDYFSCVRRRARNGGKCDSGHYRAERIELEVGALYWSLKLTSAEMAAIKEAVSRVAEEQAEQIQKAANRHRRRLQVLEEKQAKLLEWRYAGEVSASVMRRQTEQIEAEQRSLTQLLARSEVQLAEIDDALDAALALTERPLEVYLDTGELGRRMLNQAFFSEIRVGPSGDVMEATLEPIYARIIAPRLIRRETGNGAVRAQTMGQGRSNPDPSFSRPGFDYEQNGAPGEIRTPDLRFRRPTLYPAELRALSWFLPANQPFLRTTRLVPRPLPRADTRRSGRICALVLG